MRAELAIGLRRAGDGSVVATGALAVPPFWCRWDGETLWLVGSAATPVGDDDITIALDVGEGVTAIVRSVAAMIVYAARGDGTRMTTRVHVAAGATLTWTPEPVIVTARAMHRSMFTADVQAGGTLVADELVVLGRTDEVPGGYMSTTELRRDGVPTYLSSFDTATPGWAGPGGTASAKVVGSRLAVGPYDRRDEATSASVGANTVVMHPEAGGSTATTLAATTEQARARLDEALPTFAMAPPSVAETGRQAWAV